MILGLDRHPAAACFVEIDEAVRQLRGRDDVVFNAHVSSIDLRAWARRVVVFNMENVPLQVNPRKWWDGSSTQNLWDFSRLSISKYPVLCPVKHVPVGYHTSMERFRPRPYSERDIDIVFTGHPNVRRNYVIDELRNRGLNVLQVGHGVYGEKRDAILARAKLALNMLYYDNGVFPALRVAHLVANRVPVLSEVCPEGWAFVPTVEYNGLVDTAYDMVTRRREYLDHLAESAYVAFRMNPMRLPE